jgi:hypothetical protein
MNQLGPFFPQKYWGFVVFTESAGSSKGLMSPLPTYMDGKSKPIGQGHTSWPLNRGSSTTES